MLILIVQDGDISISSLASFPPVSCQLYSEPKDNLNKRDEAESKAEAKETSHAGDEVD